MALSKSKQVMHCYLTSGQHLQIINTLKGCYANTVELAKYSVPGTAGLV